MPVTLGGVAAQSRDRGSRPVTGAASSGLVPQVTIGAISGPESVTSRSNVAPSSLGSVRQKAIARSHASPFGA